MLSFLPTARTRTALVSVALVVLAGCSSSTDTSEAAPAVTETTIAAVADEEASSDTPVDDAVEPDENTPTTNTTEPDTTEAPVTTEEAAVSDGVITDIVADASGGRSTFDGEVDELSDLDDLVVDAWGNGDLGLHRGHAQVENVLEAFLGIDHDGMHDYMDDGFNLAALSQELGKNADDLVETLTASYTPFVIEGVKYGVITDAEAAEWIDLLHTEFEDRVYWDGVSAS